MRPTRLAMRAAIWISAALVCTGTAGRAAGTHPNGLVGTTFPADFPSPIDASLGIPVIGFGGRAGGVEHVPVIFLHGNNDTPFPPPATPSAYPRPGPILPRRGIQSAGIVGAGIPGRIDRLPRPAELKVIVLGR